MHRVHYLRKVTFQSYVRGQPDSRPLAYELMYAQRTEIMPHRKQNETKRGLEDADSCPLFNEFAQARIDNSCYWFQTAGKQETLKVVLCYNNHMSRDFPLEAGDSRRHLRSSSQ